MFVKRFLLVLSCAMSISFTAASLTPLKQVRHAPSTSSPETSLALRRALSSVDTLKRSSNIVLKNSTSLSKSWDGAVLYTFTAEGNKGNISAAAEIEIVCTTCYVKGTVTAQLTIDGNFNASQAFDNFKSQIKHDVENITNTFTDTVESYVKNTISNITSDISSDTFDIDDFKFPTIPFDLQLDAPDIPECQLRFQFDGLELYMEIDTILSGSATYNLPLYKSESPLGISVNDELQVGVQFTIDLILSVEAEIDISSGFHIQLNDGAAIELPMFSQNVSSITFNGGSFEFLPVKVQSAGVALTALLRIGAHAGVNVGTPPATILGHPIGASVGAEAAVFVDIAEFITNVTLAPPGDTSGCELHVVEVYSMLVGANAGATVAVTPGHSWGPTPNTTIPVYYTTLADACAVTKMISAASSTAVATGVLRARGAHSGDLTTTTISTSITYTGIACSSTGMLNCPVSLQTTSTYSTTQTLVTSVPSGSHATFPSMTQNTVTSTIAFGTNAKGMASVSGPPVTYTPGAVPGSHGFAGGKTKGVSNKIIIGVSIGLGFPVLMAITAGIIFYCKRKRYSAVQIDTAYEGPQSFQTPEPYTHVSFISGKKSPNVAVTENTQRY